MKTSCLNNNSEQPRRLSKRLTQVLQFYAEGFCTKEIASALMISPKTVEYHRACLYRQTGLNSIALLTQFALRHGIARFVV